MALRKQTATSGRAADRMEASCFGGGGKFFTGPLPKILVHALDGRESTGLPSSHATGDLLGVIKMSRSFQDFPESFYDFHRYELGSVIQNGCDYVMHHLTRATPSDRVERRESR